MTNAATLCLIVPGDPDQRTGGFLYDAHMAGQLRQGGWTVDVVGLEGRFPLTDRTAGRAMDRTLASLAPDTKIVIDGLALGGLPDIIAHHANRLEITALVHHPLCDETGLTKVAAEKLLASERRALAACHRVIVTSRFTARRLRELDLWTRTVHVVEPGTDPAPLAATVIDRLAGREAPAVQHLLCVASVTERKGQVILVRALAPLHATSFHCVVAGSLTRDPEYAGRVQALIRQSGMSDRITLAGERGAEQLARDYHRTSVCILPSYYEGFGMVVHEALARGLPVIGTTGGALADTLPADCSLRAAPGDVLTLTRALDAWMSDPKLRLRLTERAAARRETLPDWRQAGRRFAEALSA